MAKKITIRDLASAAGVSVTTVSQILNGKGNRFSKATQEKVLHLRDELGYVPDFNARNLILRSSKTIGVLVPNLNNPFFSTFIHGVDTTARKKGFIALVFGANHEEDLERFYLRQLMERSVDGFIIASASITAKTIDDLLKPWHSPYVLFDQNGNRAGDRLEVDDYAGGKKAAEYLVKMGHRKIVMLHPKEPTINVNNRLKGFTDGLHDAGIDFDPDRDIVSAKLTKAGGYEQTDAVLAKHPTVVFSANDEMAIGLMRGLHERGLKVPDDISVMGYDNIDFDEYVTPKLTTIEQPMHQIGEEATNMLIKRVQNPDMELQTVHLPVKLVTRDSVKNLKK